MKAIKLITLMLLAMFIVSCTQGAKSTLTPASRLNLAGEPLSITGTYCNLETDPDNPGETFHNCEQYSTFVRILKEGDSKVGYTNKAWAFIFECEGGAFADNIAINGTDVEVALDETTFAAPNDCAAVKIDVSEQDGKLVGTYTIQHADQGQNQTVRDLNLNKVTDDTDYTPDFYHDQVGGNVPAFQ